MINSFTRYGIKSCSNMIKDLGIEISDDETIDVAIKLLYNVLLIAPDESNADAINNRISEINKESLIGFIGDSDKTAEFIKDRLYEFETINERNNDIAYFFNRNDLNSESLKKIRKQWDKPIYEADLWDYNERQEFDLLKLECDAAYEYYSNLHNYIEKRKFMVDVPIPFDIMDWNSSIISDEVKAELKETVDVLQKYSTKASDYSSTFDERNY